MNFTFVTDNGRRQMYLAKTARFMRNETRPFVGDSFFFLSERSMSYCILHL